MPPYKPSIRTLRRPIKSKTIKAAANWDQKTESRHHIFLFDGTCNDETGTNPAEFRWNQRLRAWFSIKDPTLCFPPIITNVAKTMHSLAPDSDRQLTHYFPGIANDDQNDASNALFEGIFAQEEESIRNYAYLEFLTNYRRGDCISILGFSRGAATARLFSNDLRKRGLLKSVRAKTRLRGSLTSGDSWIEAPELSARRSKSLVTGADIPIAFVGLWDTVATGIRASADDLEPCNVGRIVHCLALDEERELFAPALLQSPSTENVKEVWFPGCHSDIGGGYFYDALGRVTLQFMWENWNTALAKQNLPPLDWKQDAVASYTDTTDLRWLRHNENTGITAKGGLSPRVCTRIGGGRPRVHSSVDDFIQNGGLSFCHPEIGFPPQPKVSGSVYSPPAYPGAQNAESYKSTEWI